MTRLMIKDINIIVNKCIHMAWYGYSITLSLVIKQKGGATCKAIVLEKIQMIIVIYTAESTQVCCISKNLLCLNWVSI